MFKINLVNLPSPLKIKMDYKFPEVLPVKLQKKEVQPRTVSQLVYPDSGFDGLSEVSVNAVTNEIDENIKSENIKKDISILGVQGNIEELKGTKLEITKNGTYTPEEPYNAFTKVEANMEPDLSEYFITEVTSARGLLKKIPSFTLTSSTLAYFFQDYSNLESIENITTSQSVTNMDSTFRGCVNLKAMPFLDTSNVGTMHNLFYFSQYEISNHSLENVPKLNASKITYIDGAFNRAYTSQSFSNFTTFGGFENLGQSYLTTATANYSYYNLNLSACPALTHDSLMNVINNLYDIATKGVKTQQLVLGSTNIAKLTTEELAIGTSKGWSIS